VVKLRAVDFDRLQELLASLEKEGVD